MKAAARQAEILLIRKKKEKQGRKDRSVSLILPAVLWESTDGRQSRAVKAIVR